MFKFRVAYLVLTLLAVSSPVLSEEKPSLFIQGGLSALISTLDGFYIEVSDQVSGGCLPQPNRLKDKFEISLRKNGFEILSEEKIFGNKILITALGFDSGGCSVHLSAKLITYMLISVPYSNGTEYGTKTLAPYVYDIASGIFTGSKSGMQARLEKNTQEFADDLFLKVSRAQDEMRNSFAEIIRNFEARNRE